MAAIPEKGGGRQVLDIGCGDGHLAAILTARGYSVTGIERPDGHGDVFLRQVKLIEADLDNGLPPLDQVFDYILCADILEHLRRPEMLLRQIHDVLAPGGALIASLPNSGNIWFRLNILAGRFPRDDKGLFDRTHLHFYMWNGWLKLFEAAGFSITTIEPTAIPVGLVVPNSWESTAPVRMAERVCYGLAHIWKTLFAYQFVVRAVVR